MRILRTLCCVALLVAPLPLLAEPSAEELEQNRRKLQEWRKNPEQYQQLQKDAKAFFALPEDQQTRILALDQDLRRESAAQQARLGSVVSRYVDWLERLDEKDRQRVKDAPDKQARLAVIRDLRDQEWMKGQPRALRDQFAALTGNARAELVKKLRVEDRQRRVEWQIASRFWKELEKGSQLPCRLSDFPNDVNNYFTEYLQHMLTKEERDRLDKAQGQWPLFPVTLVELADKHPPALLGPEGPRYFKELPAEVQKRFFKGAKGAPKALKLAEGKWPDFAHAVILAAGKKNANPFAFELWAWGRSCLSPPMQEFVDRKLFKALDIDEKYRFTTAEGKWPDYPDAIQELARKHNLQVPWQTLPGARERWDNYRNIRAIP
jgi:hypothetical protein